MNTKNETINVRQGWSKFRMADEIIELIEPNSSLNLGIGMPTLIAERMPREKRVFIHSENGVLGVSGRPTRQTVSPTLINAGKETISIGPGASFFDSALSFGMIRGGHIDMCVLGGMEVDCAGNLANWMIPGKKVTGMGGAMDLVNGAKQIIVMLTHFSKDGDVKLVKQCSLPLTGKAVVDLVVTDLGIFRPAMTHFVVEKMADGIGLDDLGPRDLFFA
ncbi:MAG TPA: 3-oxoacid CoA-transferase subunit B [Pirellulaceae bacterium]|nr:3-oxoacid CoA-transferase subunit B [Pirellulaceae bacterium]HMO94077.1 3-oxoacid CoA-transferase subunit B [Pirellulaceae bacterium]HMP71150.1 3-oxoacid CoA-transferase subunit B [Pirellulaceae bacterium]